MQNFIPLNAEYIKKEIENPNIELIILEQVDSTNNYLKAIVSANSRIICLSESQSNGKGSKQGRIWHSPFGQNIYMSYAYPFKKNTDLSGLSLVVGIAVINAIKEIGILEPIMLKWPNDGIYQGQKIMGNLIETKLTIDGDYIVIIGMGINVNMLDSQEENISQEWTSLRKITGNSIDRNQLAVAMIHNLNICLEQFIKYGLREFMESWKKLDYLLAKTIRINNGNNEIIGTVKGIDEKGMLLLEMNNGEIKAFLSGEACITNY